MSQLIIPIPRTRPSLQEVSETVISWLCKPPADISLSEMSNWRNEHWKAARWAIWAQGIGPLLYKHLRNSLIFERFPESLQCYLANQHELNGQRVAIMMSELSVLLKAADQADIAIVPLKGSVLVSYYYDDAALRPMSDLDILVHPDDERRLNHILMELGYQWEGDLQRHRKYVLKHLPNRLVYNGEHPDNPRSLDAHTEIRENLWGTYYQITQDLWADGQPGIFGDAPGILSHPVALLKHLLFHAGAHLRKNIARFIQLMDIALVGSHLSHVEWRRLTQGIQKSHQEHLFYPPLSLAERYLGRIAPEEVVRDLARGTPRDLRLFLQRTPFSYFSSCNPHPVSLVDGLRWCRHGIERAIVPFYLATTTDGQQRVIGWLLRRSMGLSRYYYFHDISQLLRLLQING